MAATTTEHDLRVLSDRWTAAWNAGDADAVAEMCTEDVQIFEPVLPEHRTSGRAAMRDIVRMLRKAYPDLRVTQEHVLIDGDRMAVTWRASGTNTGELEPQGFAATGRRVDLPGMALCEVRDGLFSRIDQYYDVMDHAVQIGIMPPHGSREERLMVRLQRLRARRRARR